MLVHPEDNPWSDKLLGLVSMYLIQAVAFIVGCLYICNLDTDVDPVLLYLKHVVLLSTCRPETMYGQTNCWALPDGDYAAYRGLNGEVYVMTERSALNLSYQVIFLLPDMAADERGCSSKQKCSRGDPLMLVGNNYQQSHGHAAATCAVRCSNCQTHACWSGAASTSSKHD